MQVRENPSAQDVRMYGRREPACQLYTRQEILQERRDQEDRQHRRGYAQRPMANGSPTTLNLDRLRGQYFSGRITWDVYRTRAVEIATFREGVRQRMVYNSLPRPPMGYIWVRDAGGRESDNWQYPQEAGPGWAYILYDLLYTAGGCPAPCA